MDEDLAKSRRNLIVISILLILFDVAAVSVAKVSVIGTELLIGNPAVVRVFLWVLWGYLLLRYLQFLGAQEHLGLRQAYTDRMNKHLQTKMHAWAEKAVPGWNGSYSDVSFQHLKRRGVTWSQELLKYEPSQGKQAVVGELVVPASRILTTMLRSFLFVAFATPRVTDHVVPLLLAIAAPVVTAIA